jgi:hypothetical protein
MFGQRVGIAVVENLSLCSVDPRPMVHVDNKATHALKPVAVDHDHIRLLLGRHRTSLWQRIKVSGLDGVQFVNVPSRLLVDTFQRNRSSTQPIETGAVNDDWILNVSHELVVNQTRTIHRRIKCFSCVAMSSPKTLKFIECVNRIVSGGWHRPSFAPSLSGTPS